MISRASAIPVSIPAILPMSRRRTAPGAPAPQPRARRVKKPVLGTDPAADAGSVPGRRRVKNHVHDDPDDDKGNDNDSDEHVMIDQRVARRGPGSLLAIAQAHHRRKLPDYRQDSERGWDEKDDDERHNDHRHT